MAHEIIPDPSVEDQGRTGRLQGISAADIVARLGFSSNRQDDPDKVRYSWGFTVNGFKCAIWDYKGSGAHGSFSTWGSREVLSALFGNHFA